MPNWVKGLLTGVLWTGHGVLAGYLLNLAFDAPLEPGSALLIGGIFGLLYGLEAGILRSKPYFEPPSASVASGFFGWIYCATLFELWAYGSGNP